MDSQPTLRPLTFRLGGLHIDTRGALILVLTTLLLMVDAYHRFLGGNTFIEILRGKAIERLVYYLLIPLAVIVLVFGDRPRDYGFTVGDWRQGLKWTGIVLLLAVPVIVASGRTPEMRGYYDLYRGGWPELLSTFGLDLLGWEFVFRGFLLFGLYRLMGPTAVIAQAVPFALAHIGKPELETLSTIFGGTLFGWVAWRSRSFVYPFLIHWFIFSVTVFVARSGF
jgi:membrane protease YdiL (CAAX protease family)